MVQKLSKKFKGSENYPSIPVFLKNAPLIGAWEYNQEPSRQQIPEEGEASGFDGEGMERTMPDIYQLSTPGSLQSG